MSGSFEAMRLWVPALLVAACGDDPSLHVAIDHPGGIDIARSVVSIYESASLRCDDVAFGRVTAGELDAALVDEETITADGMTTGGLSGISRTDNKVIVARGYSASGAWVTAGCAEHGVVDGRTNVTIATMPTVNVSIVPPTASAPFTAGVSATDASGKAVANRRVSWTVYGPAGSIAMTTASTISAGEATWQPAVESCTANELIEIHPVPPNIVGGFAVQLRAEWPVQLPALYTSFANADFSFTPFTPPNPTSTQKFCAAKIVGASRSLVCLDGSVARELSVTASGGVATLTTINTQAIGADAYAVVSVPQGSDRHVYMITRRGHIFALFGAPAADDSTPVCPGIAACDTPVDDVLVVPPCGPQQPGKLLLHLDTTQRPTAPQVVQMNARGGGLTVFATSPTPVDPLIRLDNAGCVTRLDPNGGTPTLRQVITLHQGRNIGEFVPTATRALYNCQAGCVARELVVGAGVGFTTGSESRMVLTSVDATGVVLLQVVMNPESATRDGFVERARYPAASIPDQIVTGQFDSDSAIDLFWNLSGRRGTSFEVAYARQVGTQPLEALSLIQPAVVYTVISADLTGDGKDDIFVVGGESSTGTLRTGVGAIAMHAPARPITMPAAAACAP